MSKMLTKNPTISFYIKSFSFLIIISLIFGNCRPLKVGYLKTPDYEQSEWPPKFTLQKKDISLSVANDYANLTFGIDLDIVAGKEYNIYDPQLTIKADGKSYLLNSHCISKYKMIQIPKNKLISESFRMDYEDFFNLKKESKIVFLQLFDLVDPVTLDTIHFEPIKMVFVE